MLIKIKYIIIIVVSECPLESPYFKEVVGLKQEKVNKIYISI